MNYPLAPLRLGTASATDPAALDRAARQDLAELARGALHTARLDGTALAQLRASLAGLADRTYRQPRVSGAIAETALRLCDRGSLGRQELDELVVWLLRQASALGRGAA
jgi:hypothetical protein